MAVYTARSASGFLGLAALIMGGLGLVMYFFQPFGIIFGAAGVVVGVAALVVYWPRGGTPLHLALGGLILSAAALVTGLALPMLLTRPVDQDYNRPRIQEGSPYTAPHGKVPPPYPRD
jgi:hypothetical protein